MEKGHVNIAHHSEGVYAVGDVHGDMFALLRVLQVTGCVNVDARLLHQSARCYSNQYWLKRGSVEIRKEAEITDIKGSIRWTGGNKCIVFLGDILDNRRSPDAPKNGMCAWEGTQFQMLDILVHLKAEARRNGGNIVWVIGNHDVWNAAKTRGGSICHVYGPQKQMCLSKKLCQKPEKVYASCGRDGNFTEAHRQNVRRYMIELEAVALLRISAWGKQGQWNTHVLALHGGLTNIPALFRDVGLVLDKGSPSKHQTNIDHINAFYDRAIHEEDEYALSKIDSAYMPTWCRPKTIENESDMEQAFGTKKMVKGHDVQRLKAGGQANCNANGKRTSYFTQGEDQGKKEEFTDGELCRMDVGMSRAFDMGYQQQEFSCVKLTSTEEEPGRMYRQLYRTTEDLNRENEYSRYLK